MCIYILKIPITYLWSYPVLSRTKETTHATLGIQRGKRLLREDAQFLSSIPVIIAFWLCSFSQTPRSGYFPWSVQ